MALWTQLKRAQRIRTEASGGDAAADEDEDEEEDDGDWVEKKTPGGNPCLYNTKTGETKVPEDEPEDDEDEEEVARMLPVGPGGLQSVLSTLRYVQRDFRKKKSGPRTPRPPRWPPGPGFLSVARGRAA
jgi:hypothetical protein